MFSKHPVPTISPVVYLKFWVKWSHIDPFQSGEVDISCNVCNKLISNSVWNDQTKMRNYLLSFPEPPVMHQPGRTPSDWTPDHLGYLTLSQCHNHFFKIILVFSWGWFFKLNFGVILRIISSLESDWVAFLNQPLLLSEAGCWQSRGPVLTHRCDTFLWNITMVQYIFYIQCMNDMICDTCSLGLILTHRCDTLLW